MLSVPYSMLSFKGEAEAERRAGLVLQSIGVAEGGGQEAEAGFQVQADAEVACVAVHAQSAGEAKVVGVCPSEVGIAYVAAQGGEVEAVAEARREVRLEATHAERVEFDINGHLAAYAFYLIVLWCVVADAGGFEAVVYCRHSGHDTQAEAASKAEVENRRYAQPMCVGRAWNQPSGPPAARGAGVYSALGEAQADAVARLVTVRPRRFLLLRAGRRGLE